MTENQLVPFFGGVPLNKITTADVNKWLLGFGKREVTEWYSHPDARQLDAIIEAQAVIAGTEQPKGGKSGGKVVQKGQDNLTLLRYQKT